MLNYAWLFILSSGILAIFPIQVHAVEKCQALFAKLERIDTIPREFILELAQLHVAAEATNNSSVKKAIRSDFERILGELERRYQAPRRIILEKIQVAILDVKQRDYEVQEQEKRRLEELREKQLSQLDLLTSRLKAVDRTGIAGEKINCIIDLDRMSYHWATITHQGSHPYWTDDGRFLYLRTAGNRGERQSYFFDTVANKVLHPPCGDDGALSRHDGVFVENREDGVEVFDVVTNLRLGKFNGQFKSDPDFLTKNYVVTQIKEQRKELFLLNIVSGTKQIVMGSLAAVSARAQRAAYFSAKQLHLVDLKSGKELPLPGDLEFVLPGSEKGLTADVLPVKQNGKRGYLYLPSMTLSFPKSSTGDPFRLTDGEIALSEPEKRYSKHQMTLFNPANQRSVDIEGTTAVVYAEQGLITVSDSANGNTAVIDAKTLDLIRYVPQGFHRIFKGQYLYRSSMSSKSDRGVELFDIQSGQISQTGFQSVPDPVPNSDLWIFSETAADKMRETWVVDGSFDNLSRSLGKGPRGASASPTGNNIVATVDGEIIVYKVLPAEGTQN